MHRRRFLQTATLTGIAGASLLTGTRAAPRVTSASATEATLAKRVASIAPEHVLDALLATPVTTPLLPADTPPVEPVAWDDPGDADLTDTVGAVVFTTGQDANGNELGIGNAIVHPDADAAASMVARVGPAETQRYLGMPWFVQSIEDYAVSVVQIDYLLLVGGAETPSGENVGNGSEVSASPVPSEAPPRLELRAVSHMTALLDHLDGVLSGMEA